MTPSFLNNNFEKNMIILNYSLNVSRPKDIELLINEHEKNFNHF